MHAAEEFRQAIVQQLLKLFEITGQAIDVRDELDLVFQCRL